MEAATGYAIAAAVLGGCSLRGGEGSILGIVLGGQLVGQRVSSVLLGIDLPLIDTGINTPAEAAITAIMVEERAELEYGVASTEALGFVGKFEVGGHGVVTLG